MNRGRPGSGRQKEQGDNVLNQALEKVKAFGGKAGEFLKKLSKKVYIAAAVALVLVAAVIAVLLNNRPYVTLVTDVSADETATVLNLLSQWGVTDYRVEGSGTVLVPESQEAALKARLIMENVGQTGHYYSTYFDNISAISTEAERNKAWLIDMSEKLRTTIRNMENVKDAEVFLNEGTDQSYVLARNRMINATASVQVEMNNGAKLSTRQAAAIRNLVTGAIQGLEIERISITDTYGNTYSGGALDETGDATALKLQLEEEESNRIRTQVVQALGSVYGPENLDVAVSCVVEVSNSTEDQTLYWLPEYAQNGETGGRGIIGSRLWQWSYVRDGEEAVGGVVGNETNADITADFPEYVERGPDLNGTELEAGASGQTDYRTNTSQKHIVTTAGYLADCTIAVTINSTTAGNVDAQAVRQHAARAAGIVGAIDEETGQEYLADKISVLAAPFYRPTPIITPDDVLIFGFLEPWILVAAMIGLVVFLIILIIVLLILRSRRRKRQEQEEAERAGDDIDALLAAAGIAQAEPAGADVMSLQSERSMELRKDIRKFAGDNPEIAAQMLRNWLRGGEDNG